MCGFAAVFSTREKIPQSLLDNFDRDLFHRGPDSGERYYKCNLGMVFRRLAIMDPSSKSNQPMKSRDGRYVMVFNGEIYNFKSLRSALENSGHRFKTNGDSEVLLAAFIHWGTSSFSKLEGMFSCVILDQIENRVYAARDPLGIKPLYLSHNANGVGFSSEARPLRRWIGNPRPDKNAIAELLMYRYAAGKLSNYEGIELLHGGHFAEVDLNNNHLTVTSFADPLEAISASKEMSQSEAIEMAELAIMESVRTHLQSDVGYSLQFSGGIDSSLVLAMVGREATERVDSYAVRLSDKEHDEGLWRRAVLKQYPTNHTELTLDGRNFADALPRAIHHMDGPTPHFGCVMLLLLCDEIAKNFKVVLTGEGADEFFGGYDRYAKWRELRKFNAFGKVVPEFAWPFLKRYIYLRRFSTYDSAIVSSVYFDFLNLHEIFPELVPDFGHRQTVASRFSDFRERMMAVDQSSYLSSLLMRQDKMAMAAGVEARVPFTHMPLANIVNRIPISLRVPGGTTKPLLKEIARKWLPTEVINRRKVGLTLPLDEWLRDDKSLGRYLSLLTDSNSCLATYCDKKILRNLVDDFHSSKAGNEMPPLSHLVNMELWLRDASTPLQ